MMVIVLWKKVSILLKLEKSLWLLYITQAWEIQMKIKQWATYRILDHMENLIHEGMREKEHEGVESFVLLIQIPEDAKSAES